MGFLEMFGSIVSGGILAVMFSGGVYAVSKYGWVKATFLAWGSLVFPLVVCAPDLFDKGLWVGDFDASGVASIAFFAFLLVVWFSWGIYQAFRAEKSEDMSWKAYAATLIPMAIALAAMWQYRPIG